MAHNAKAGGEIGANGEFYKGGQFVADSADTVKGKYLASGPRKICVEPYKWVVAAPDTFAVWQLIQHNVCTWDAQTHEPCGADGYHFSMPPTAFESALLDLYKKGTRTIGITELANLRKGTGDGSYYLKGKVDLLDFATI